LKSWCDPSPVGSATSLSRKGRGFASLDGHEMQVTIEALKEAVAGSQRGR